jgi:hypothetical protein
LLKKVWDNWELREHLIISIFSSIDKRKDSGWSDCKEVEKHFKKMLKVKTVWECGKRIILNLFNKERKMIWLW